MIMNIHESVLNETNNFLKDPETLEEREILDRISKSPLKIFQDKIKELKDESK